jgi:hypothetical protein
MYKNNKLKFPLTDNEYNCLDKVYNFINDFNFMEYNLKTYRSKIINLIRKKYSINEFMYYEKIAEKLFWNLRYKTYMYFLNNYNIIKLQSGTLNEVNSLFHKDNSYRSFINKLILIQDKNLQNKYFYKKMEGSSHIFNKNKFNIITFCILHNRDLYEKIIKNPQEILSIKEPTYYFQYDYPYPNLNYGKPFIQSNNFRLKRIKKMYYDINTDKSENNWFTLIKP